VYKGDKNQTIENSFKYICTDIFFGHFQTIENSFKYICTDIFFGHFQTCGMKAKHRRRTAREKRQIRSTLTGDENLSLSLDHTSCTWLRTLILSMTGLLSKRYFHKHNFFSLCLTVCLIIVVLRKINTNCYRNIMLNHFRLPILNYQTP